MTSTAAYSLAASRRHDTAVHLAEREDVPYPEHVADGTFPWVASRSLCGVRTWGPAEGHDPTCGRCLRIVAAEDRR